MRSAPRASRFLPASRIGRLALALYPLRMAIVLRALLLWPLLLVAGLLPPLSLGAALLLTPFAVSALVVVQVIVSEGCYLWRSRATFR